MRLWLVFLVVINNFRGGKYARQRYKAYKINNQLNAWMKECYFFTYSFLKVTLSYDISKYSILKYEGPDEFIYVLSTFNKIMIIFLP